jgi:uncharacterized membrane protein YphA (DoxX/SURF4 family)
MLSIFPDLLIYNTLGVALIRIAIGLLGVYFGFKILSRKNQFVEFIISFKIPFAFIMMLILIVLFVISGGLMVVGLYTQVACVLLAYLFFKLMIIDLWSKKMIGVDSFFYIILIFISLSFVFLGSGAFSFDLPF